jgi:hypothetical protein
MAWQRPVGVEAWWVDVDGLGPLCASFSQPLSVTAMMGFGRWWAHLADPLWFEVDGACFARDASVEMRRACMCPSLVFGLGLMVRGSSSASTSLRLREITPAGL